MKVGAVHPLTGPLAEPGQACRLGAQMAAEAVNAAGGIKALGGAKIELILGDTRTKPDVGRTEAERVINQGAQILMDSFDSGSTAAMVPVVQQRRIPFLVDISAADPITANVAKAVKRCPTAAMSSRMSGSRSPARAGALFMPSRSEAPLPTHPRRARPRPARG